MKLRRLLTVTVCAVLLTIFLIGATVGAADLPFTDVPDTWYTSAVECVYSEGIMKGKTETTFDPTAKITRAEVVTAFARVAIAKTSGKGDDLPFDDTVSGQWYSESVGWAAENGIVTGRGDGRFSPADNITRAELASILTKFVTYMDIDLPDNSKIDSFKDADTFDAWMTGPIEAVRKNGLMQGSDGKFNPRGNATRAEIATVIMNLLPNVGRTSVVTDGVSDYVIVCDTENEGAVDAAERIRYQIAYVTGAELKVVDDSTAEKAKEIVIGSARKSGVDTSELILDGYEIAVKGDKVFVDAASADGLYRGAANFLNTCTSGDDVRFTSKTAERAPHEYPVKKLLINGNDISRYTIHYPANASANTLTAVDDLVKYIDMATGVTLEKSTAKAGSYAIIVDETKVVIDGSVNKSCDNFTVKSEGNSIRLIGDADRAAAYACYDFLEQLVGCVFLTSKQDYVKPAAEINIKDVNYTESPIFAIRDNYGNVPVLKNRDYAWSSANGIHTLASLAPDFCKQYVNQPCLLDEAVYDQVIENVFKALEKKPNSQIVSVSINDVAEWCDCAKCTAAIESESHTDYLLRFVNRVAEEIEKGGYTDVLVHTFAYDEAIVAPKAVTPRENVFVQFCPIEACIAHPLDADCNVGMLGMYNGKYLTDWSNIDCKKYLWTYHGNFSNCPVPHTDLSYETMGGNAKFYAESGVIGWFSQTNHRNPDVLGDFAALRNYLLSKFMWDPYMTEEEYNEHVTSFMQGYYGEGWKKIYEVFNTYIKSDTGHHTLWEPVESRMIYYMHKIDTPYLVSLFDEAELLAESYTVWKNIDRNQLSFNMMDVSVKWRSLTKAGKDDEAQLLAKWFQDKLLTYKVSYGSESDMFPNMIIGGFVDPSNWRGLLDYGAAPDKGRPEGHCSYYSKIEDLTVEYPDRPTDIQPY